MNITIIGSGYVGLTTGACFAEAGHFVLCVDNDVEKVGSLKAGQIPIFEPGLEALVKRNVMAKRLRFTASTEEGVDHGEVLFIAVPTPPQPDGSVDLSFMEKVAREIAQYLDSYRVIVDKSSGENAPAGFEKKIGFEGISDKATGYYCFYNEGRIVERGEAGEKTSLRLQRTASKPDVGSKPASANRGS